MRTLGALALACLALAACDDRPADPADGGPDDAGVDSGPTGDGNDTFATATELSLGTPVNGVIDPPGDLDYYRFEGTAGQWIQIVTTANEMDDPEMLDTVVTLYDASMRRIAENDDSLPRFNTDSELTTRLPADGTYYVLVQEWTTWADEPAEGDPSFTYELVVGELDEGAAQVNVDTEAGDDLASAQTLGAFVNDGIAFSLVAGTFDDASDVDVYSFTLPDGGSYLYSVYVMPVGDTGSGSTVDPASVWVTDAAGTEVIARIDPRTTRIPDEQSDAEISPILGAGDYRLFVSHGRTAGANDFYVLKVFRVAVALETAEAENDAVATPEALDFEEATADDPVPTAFVIGELGESDTDHFSFMAEAGERVSILCGSRTNGSGIVDLTVAVLDPADATGATTLASDTETASEIALIRDLAITTSGTYVMRVTKGSQDAEVTGDWYRCVVYRVPPAI